MSQNPPPDAHERLAVWERLDKLLDASSFREIDGPGTHGLEKYSNRAATAECDGILAGYGRIDGRDVMVFAQDSKHLGGSMGKLHASKLRRTADQAVKRGIPLIGLIDSAGARVQEGVASMSEIGGAVKSLVHASGVVPQIYALMGTAVGGAAYSAAMGDFLIMIDGTSQMFAWGPGVIMAEGNVSVTADELGGTATQMKSGVGGLSARDEVDCLNQIKRLLNYLPQNRDERPRVIKTASGDGGTPLPQIGRTPYDPRQLISAVFDEGSYLELQPEFGRSVVIGFARLDGESVGVIASQPGVGSGYIDIDASDKVCRFVRTCDCFNIPVITFVDTPGFLPNPSQERGGILRHGAKMMFAYAEAAVPKVTVVVGRAYGGGVTGLCSKPLGVDAVLAYDSADIQVLSLKSYLEIFQKAKLEALTPGERQKAIGELSAKYQERGKPEIAVSLGYVDRIIKPEDTRKELQATLGRLIKPEAGEHYHRNMPV